MKKFLSILMIIFAIHVVYACTSISNFNDFIIDMDGGIDSYSYMKFADLNKKINNLQPNKYPHKIIINLNSGGGEIEFTQKIDKIIQSWKAKGINVHTVVNDNDQCMSMCTVLFSLGDKRIASESSKWMFHSPFFFRSDYNPNTDKDKLEPDRRWMLDVLEKSRLYYYSKILVVDSDFAVHLRDNILWKHNKKIEFTGKQLKDFTKSYITELR